MPTFNIQTALTQTARLHLPNRLRPSNLHNKTVNPPLVHSSLQSGSQKQNLLLHPPAHLGEFSLLSNKHDDQDLSMLAEKKGLGQEYPWTLFGCRYSHHDCFGD